MKVINTLLFLTNMQERIQVKMFLQFHFLEPMKLLLANKLAESYSLVLRTFLDLLKQLQVLDNNMMVLLHQSMSDFELSVRDSLDALTNSGLYFRDFLRTDHITVIHYGCMFHLVQAWLRYLKGTNCRLQAYCYTNTHAEINLPSFIKKLSPA